MDQSAIRPMELKDAIRLLTDLETFLVDRAMVPTTQQDEIREHSGAAVRPVIDMMALPEAHPTAWKTAAAVAIVKSPP